MNMLIVTFFMLTATTVMAGSEEANKISKTPPSANFHVLKRLPAKDQTELRPMTDEQLSRIEGAGIYIPDTVFTRLTPWHSR